MHYQNHVDSLSQYCILRAFKLLTLRMHYKNSTDIAEKEYRNHSKSK